MHGTLHLFVCSNCPTSVYKKFIEFTEFIDRFKVENSTGLCAKIPMPWKVFQTLSIIPSGFQKISYLPLYPQNVVDSVMLFEIL